MRTILLVCCVALIAAAGVAFAVGLVSVTTEHSDGKYALHLIINANMIRSLGTGESAGAENPSAALLEVKGRVTAVRPTKNEFVVSENVKNWTFELARSGVVYINTREAKLAEMQAGDEAEVAFERQGEKLIATAVRCTRK